MGDLVINGAVNLETAWVRGCEFLGAKYAILGGAMSWVSERNLVAAISNAGGFGVIACGAMTPDLLETEIKATQALTDKPFGVNLITMHPDLDKLVDVCLSLHVGHVVLAGGVPSKETILKIKEGGAKTVCFTPTLALGKKLIRTGADALVIEGMEAGGHIGPVSTSVLAQEILPNITDVPVFIAGGIGRGEAIATYLRMGAAGCQLGTRFVCSHESIAHPAFKKAFMRANARDAVTTVQVDPLFPVIPVRALNNEGGKKFIETQHEMIAKYKSGEMDLETAQLAIEHFWAGALRRAVIDGDVEFGSVMAGQSVGMVKKEQSIEEIMEELVSQARGSFENHGDQRDSS
ncbi:nitronate monooxygenase family protein [Sneathiella sp.]|uniref:NAD(P)H-dependent flavin oxidoreductase n=1 Tax=Sneathiella sp. TaxID=1964365 RepID=UPI00262DD93A|nr:nitronate monooxygenase [Sneathiella sp.]MDF2367080.1 nitronate monooxygenase [Sneathiella sp.]